MREAEQPVTTLPDRYLVISLVSRNPYSLIWKCHDKQNERDVALKVWLSHESEVKDSTEKQFKLLSGIQHPYVVEVRDRGLAEEGYPFLVSEWISGGSMAEKAKSLSLEERSTALSYLVECLDFLHSLGYLHGDIKPANVLLSKDEKGVDTIKLTDFEFLETGGYVSPKIWKGTPAYMAPEVIRGEPVGFSSDIYSLGVLSFQLLTGRLPFEEKDLYSLAYAQLEQEPTFTQEERTKIPVTVASLVLSLLRKNPTERAEAIWRVRDILLEDNEKIKQADRRLSRYLADFLLRSKTAPYSSTQELQESLNYLLNGLDPEGILSNHLMKQSGGNPEVVNHYLHALIEKDKLTRTDGVWNLEEDIESCPLPGAIGAKYLPGDISLLSQNARTILEVTSVFQYPVRKDLIQELVSLHPVEFEKELAELFHSGWLCMEEGGNSIIRFTKGLDRDFVLTSVDSVRLTELRITAIGFLEGRLGEQDEPALLKELLQQSQSCGDRERILKYAARLSECSLASNLTAEALDYTSLALRHSDETSGERLVLLKRLADLQSESGKLKEAIDNYNSYLASVKENGAGIAQAERKLGWCHALLSNYKKAEDLLHSAIQRFRSPGMSRELLQGLIDLAATKHLQRQYEDCQIILNECENYLQNYKSSKENAKWHNLLGILSWSLGNYDTSLVHYKSALNIYEAVGLGKEAAHVANNLALLLRDQGHDQEALFYMHKALELPKRVEDRAADCHYYNNLSLIYRNLRQFDEAINAAREAQRLAQRMNNLQVEGLAHSNLGFILISTGSLDQALFHLQQALLIFKKTDDQSGEALAYFNVGEIYRIRELRELSSEFYTHSLSIRRQQGEILGMADNLAGLTKLYLEASEIDKSEKYFSEAIDLYRELYKREDETKLLLAKAEALALASRLPEAQQTLSQITEEIARPLASYVHTYRSLVEGLMEQEAGDLVSAEKKLQVALHGFSTEQDKVMLAKTALYLGNLYRQADKTKLASRYLRESLGIYRELKVSPKIQKLEDMMSESKDVEPQHVQTLLQVSQMLNQLEDEEEFLRQVLKLAIDLLGAERGAIVFYDEATSTFEVRVAFGLEEETVQDALAISKRTIREVQQTGRMFISENSQSDPLLKDHQSVRIHNILSIVCVPLRVNDRIIGALYLDSRSLTRAFTPEDQASIEALANLVSVAISKAQSFNKTYHELFQLRQKTAIAYEFPKIVGKSSAMQEVFNLVARVSPSRATILIQGETGTGKELIAELIHELSDRKNNSFIRVNCAAIPETLLESELFGIEEKTATGVRFREGKFKQADGGTIFLDEIGDMSLSTQAKVLRVLQERDFERVGGNKIIKVDVRIIAASNKDLEKLIKENVFRLDLYYRLNAITIFIPPLRERKEDIPFLIDYFLEKFGQENGKPKVKISPSVVHVLCEYEWPGNVRELMNIIQRGVVLAEQGEFTHLQLPPSLKAQTTKPTRPRRIGKLKDHLKKEEEYLITEVLKQTHWNQVKASSILDVPQSTLSRKMKEYKIKRPKTF